MIVLEMRQDQSRLNTFFLLLENTKLGSYNIIVSTIVKYNLICLRALLFDRFGRIGSKWRGPPFFPQSNYICRVQCLASSKILTPHPTSTQRVRPPPAPKAGGTHSPGGGEGDGVSIFWKTPDIGFTSYSLIPLHGFNLVSFCLLPYWPAGWCPWRGRGDMDEDDKQIIQPCQFLSVTWPAGWLMSLVRTGRRGWGW